MLTVWFDGVQRDSGVLQRARRKISDSWALCSVSSPKWHHELLNLLLHLRDDHSMRSSSSSAHDASEPNMSNWSPIHRLSLWRLRRCP